MIVRLMLCAALGLGSLGAQAQDLSLSGFGTAGYAVSNRPYALERSIDEQGTFNRDSLLGVQADVQLNAQWSGTVQLRAAESLHVDGRWDVTPSWAFVAWRPSDDWLLRAGRFRVPLYLHSESMDVGQTYDLARMPAEIYAMAPATDFDGAYASRSWMLGNGDLSLDIYDGRIKTTARFWLSEGAPPQLGAGANFVNVDVRSTGAAVTFRQPDALWRLGVHRAITRRGNGEQLPVSYPFVPLGQGLGYYQVFSQLPGPGVPTVDSIGNDLFTLGLEQQFLQRWRVAAEFARNVQRDTELGSDTRGGYVALSRAIGHATPYVSIAAMRSSAGSLSWYQRLTRNPLPAVVPGAAPINAAELVAAQSFYAIDQRSLALGSAYAIDNRQKLKIEWKRTHIGQVSYLIATPFGSSAPHDTNIDVLSVNYSFTF